MSVDDLFPQRLHFTERALAVHREFTLVRGCPFLREHQAASENCLLTEWEQAIVDGRSYAIVVHLLNRELASFGDCIGGPRARRNHRTARRKKAEEVLTFDEVNRLILKWSVLAPDWTPALSEYQREKLHPLDGAANLPPRRPCSPVRTHLACSARSRSPGSSAGLAAGSSSQSAHSRSGGRG
jgi:hypothetical protein